MGLVVEQVALERIILPVLLLPLSVSFQQRFMLIFILILLLTDGRAGEGWEPLNKRTVISCFEER